MRWPASLRGRLIATAALAVCLAVAIAGAAVWVLLDRFVRGQVDAQLDAQIATVAAALERGPRAELRLGRPVEGPPFDRRGRGWYWEVRGDDSRALRSASLGDGRIALDETREDGARDRPRPAEATGPKGEALWARLRRIGPGGPVIVATAPLEAIHGPLRTALATVSLTLGAVAAALVAAILVQVGLGLRPLRRLEAALADVRAGRRDSVPTDQPTELRALAGELNALLRENAETLSRARMHVANLAHGLKTPLATLTLALAEPGRDPDGRLGREIDGMDRRVRHHLRRARAAALAGPVRARTPLGPPVDDLAEAFRRLFAAKGLAIETAVPAGLALAVEREDLDEMLGNLAENACRWCRSQVAIRAEGDGREVSIRVEDDGPGLDAAARVAVLRPGLRLDESEPGSGFGLPITRELAELYGGSLALGEGRAGGLLATLTLPAASQN